MAEVLRFKFDRWLEVSQISTSWSLHHPILRAWGFFCTSESSLSSFSVIQSGVFLFPLKASQQTNQLMIPWDYCISEVSEHLTMYFHCFLFPFKLFQVISSFILLLQFPLPWTMGEWDSLPVMYLLSRLSSQLLGVLSHPLHWTDRNPGLIKELQNWVVLFAMKFFQCAQGDCTAEDLQLGLPCRILPCYLTHPPCHNTELAHMCHSS